MPNTEYNLPKYKHAGSEQITSEQEEIVPEDYESVVSTMM